MSGGTGLRETTAQIRETQIQSTARGFGQVSVAPTQEGLLRTIENPRIGASGSESHKTSLMGDTEQVVD